MSVYGFNGNVLTSGGNSNSGIPSCVIIAAKNSSQHDKEIADYVCDGINDENEMQSAVDSLTSGGVVKLCNGDYYINDFNVKNESNGYYVAVAMKDTTAQREIFFDGVSAPIRENTGSSVDGSAKIVSGAIIHIPLSTLQKCNNSYRNSVFGVDASSRDFMKNQMRICNVGIEFADNQHSIIGIDGKYLSMMQVENVLIAAVDNASAGVQECIGIFGLEGANFGYGYRITNTKMVGLGTGYWMNGEHLIMEQCNARHCNYSYMFQQNVTQQSTHDATIINCCCELCCNFPVFSSGNFKMPYHLINFNAEIYGDSSKAYATKKMATGNGYGIIEYSIGSTSTWMNQDIEFFESGHGSGFKCINMIKATS